MAKGSPETTAQLHPAKFTQALVDAAVEKGAKLVIGKSSSSLGLILSRESRWCGNG